MATVTVQEQGQQSIGLGTFNNGYTLAITNNAGSSVLGAWAFVCPKIMASGYFNDYTFYVSAVADSPTVTGYLYADSGAGAPGAAIETGATTCAPTGAGYYTIGGFSATSALTEGAQYWVVLKCTAGTSATISYYGNTNDIYSHYVTGTYWGSHHISSSDNGSTWAGTRRNNAVQSRFSVTDGTDVAYFGFPAWGQTAQQGTTDKLCTNSGNVQEVGSLFTTPANGSLKVKGAYMVLRKIGSPAGSVVLKLYKGGTLLGTSKAAPPGALAGTPSYAALYFSSPLTLSPSTAHRIVAANTAADDTSFNYYYTYAGSIHDDATSRTLIPFGAQKTVLSGSTWTETNTLYIPFALILDTDGEFAATASGGGMTGQHTILGLGR